MSALGRGKPSPLGATYDGAGVNFAVYSGLAHRIELCLFDDPAAAEASAVHELPERSAGVFHGYLPGCRPGQVYGYRAHGVYDPAAGRRCNPAKLLLDPYARAIAGRLDWEGPIHAYPVGHPQTDMVVDGRDDAGSVPKSVVVDGVFEWQGDQRPNTPWSDTLIYEAHVKGLTRAHPEVPPELRGTYLGLAHPAVIDHLRGLGVTAVELLPIFEIVDESALIRRGLVNYWGYSTLGYFAPAARYASGARGQQVVEFRQMVRALHRAGIEVILDVVYNHSGEGSHLGPTLSLRGLDNVAYYRLVPGQPRYYADTSGCGNSLDLAHPATLRLVMDSLRYWAGEMHVDGFRFDLAPSLARDHGGFDPNARFLAAVHQDPLLSQLKLIAEPWDLGPGGYCLGAFPAPWAEWNGKYRDNVRRFWRGEPGQVGELGSRLSGSSDVFGPSGRPPQASVNFVTCHDGFTLRDLVSYSRKHNLANGEDNRDGSDHEASDNNGVEGPTDDPRISALRERQIRNLLATLFLSQGVPMLLAGDELGRTQHGNNNAYCQDSPISWVSWAESAASARLLQWTQALSELRRAHPVLRRRRYFSGRRIDGSRLPDITWLRPDGRPMSPDAWILPNVHELGVLLADEAEAPAEREAGEVCGLLILINGRRAPLSFNLPTLPFDQVKWQVLLDSRDPAIPEHPLAEGQGRYEAVAASVVVLRFAAQGPTMAAHQEHMESAR